MSGTRLRTVFTIASRRVQVGLAGLAGSLLVVKTLPDVLPLEELLSLLLIGVVTSVDAVGSEILLIGNLLLVFLTALALVPPLLDPLLTDNRWFRRLIAALTAGHTGLILLRQGEGSLLRPLLGSFGAAIGLCFLAVWLLPADRRRIARTLWRQIVTRDPTITTADPDYELQRSRDYWLALLLAATLAGVLTLVAGTLGAALLFFSPALELVVIGWVVASSLQSRGWIGIPNRLVRDRGPRPLAIESRVFGVLEHLGHPKGNATVLLVSLGLVLAGATAIAAVELAVLQFDTGGSPSVVPTWTDIGEVVSLFSIASYSLWFWLRTIPRVSGFLTAWRTGPQTAPVATEIPTRPPGMLAPMLPACLVLGLALHPSALGLHWVPSSVVTVGWPLGIAVIVAAVLWTDHTPPQAPFSEEYALPVAIGCQAAGVALALPYTADNGAMFVLLVTAGYGVFFRPSLRRIVGRPTSRRVLGVYLGYHAGLTLLLVGIGMLGQPQIASTAFLLAMMFGIVGTGAVLTYVST